MLSARKSVAGLRPWVLLQAVSCAAMLILSCGDDSGTNGVANPICVPDALQSCTDAEGCSGQARCASDGLSVGACECGAGPDAGSVSQGGMGDGGAVPGSGGSSGNGSGGQGNASEGGAPTRCVDACDPESPSECNTGSVSSCFVDPLSECAVLLEFGCSRDLCADENHCATCVHECATVGAAGCALGQLGSCVRDEEGCLKWDETQACASGFCADDQVCGTCDHTCDTVGEVECQDGESRVCAQDAFGCRAWWEWSECPTLQCSSTAQCWVGYSVGQRGTPKHDEARSLVLDERGAVATAGAYHSFGELDYRQDTDAYLQVRDATDQLIKDALWGSTADDSAMDVAVDTAFRHVVVGWTTGRMGNNAFHGGRDAFVTVWGDDPQEPVWTRQWGSPENDTARAVVTDAANNVFVVGSTNGLLGEAHAGGDDLFVTKWDSAGNRLWTRQWGTVESDVVTSAAIDSAGHLWIAGRTAGALSGQSSSGGYDAFVLELDGEGTEVNALQFGTAYGDAAEAIAIDHSGNVFVLGVTQGDLGGEANAGGIDAFLVKLDSSLTPIWTRLWGTTSEDLAVALTLDAVGNPYAAITVQATTDPGCDPGQIWAAGWDTDGVSTLSESWDSCGADAASGIAVRPDGQVLLVGWTEGDLVSESRGGKDIVSITLQP